MVHAHWNGVRHLHALSSLELTVIRARVVNKQLTFNTRTRGLTLGNA